MNPPLTTEQFLGAFGACYTATWPAQIVDDILAGSVLFGWLFARTQGSVLPALVLYTSLNAWAGILGIVPTAATGGSYAWVIGILVVIALALLLTPEPMKASPP